MRMRKIKYLFWLIIATILATFLYQNKDFFLDYREIGINLYFFQFTTPEMPTGFYYLAIMVIGFLAAYFLSLSNQFKNRKIIRKLNEQVSTGEKRISELESRLTGATAVSTQEAASGDTGE